MDEGTSQTRVIAVDILTFGGVDSLGGVVLPVKRFVMIWPQPCRIDLELNEGSFLALGSRSVVEALPTLWDELGTNFWAA